jgi:hypothetical protein
MEGAMRTNKLPVSVYVFCNFYLVKNHKIGGNATMIEAKENISTDF